MEVVDDSLPESASADGSPELSDKGQQWKDKSRVHAVAHKVFDTMLFAGEVLVDFFGLEKSPYQEHIDIARRQRKRERRRKRMQDAAQQQQEASIIGQMEAPEQEDSADSN
uniref:Uncharacterized protein n=1 Tax=Oxyrrhis marina TaxID=2969 RepID=A0A7S3UL10_OXYMA|mmetsp:Transcript_2118/g.3211  ORF Transcript_2118/g.3211 Transcript_2118/m.3211 type:complete len:111 (-) Transcript_2118:27-359(-)